MKKSITLFCLLTIIAFATTAFATIATTQKDTVPIEVHECNEIQDFYNFSSDYSTIWVMNDNKICFTNQGRLFIYDLTKHKLVDNVLLSEDFNDFHFTNWIKLLSNENILIMQNKEIKGKPFNYKDSYTLIKIYSPKDKKIVFEKKFPRMSNWNYSVAELSENKLIFFGSAYENLRECLILDTKNNNVQYGPQLNVERNSANVISLNNGNFFIFGGVPNKKHPDNFAEIYNPKSNKYIKVPMNFNVDTKLNNTRLLKLNNGNVLILCDRAYETPRKTGKKTGFLQPNGKWINYYPESYLTIFNPKDNSFEEIDINKDKKGFRNEYDVLALSNDRILITGGYNTSSQNSKPATDILVYDIKSHKLSKTSQDFKYTHTGTSMSYLLNDGSVLVSGYNLHFPLLDNKVEKIHFK